MFSVNIMLKLYYYHVKNRVLYHVNILFFTSGQTRAKKYYFGPPSGPQNMARDGSGSPKTPSGRASGRAGSGPDPSLIIDL